MVNKVSAGIIGMGYALPERKITNEYLEKVVDTTDEWITEKVGVKERYFADGKSFSDLGIEAARDAISDSKIKADDIGLVIAGTTTHDYYAGPFTSTIIKDTIGAIEAAAFDINVACTSFVNGLEMAGAFIGSGKYNNILIVCGEVWTQLPLFFKNRTTAVILGDGVGAVVVSRVECGGLLNSVSKAQLKDSDALVRPYGGSRNPITKEVMEQEKDVVYMDGGRLFNFAVKAFNDRTKEACEGAGIKVDELDIIVSHQANINIIKKGMSNLGLPLDKTHTVIEKYGNTGGGSTIIALSEAVSEGKVKKGDLVGLVQFGSGLASGAVVMRWCY